MAVRLGMLSTFTPTQCGIATFTAALTTHLTAGGDQVGVVRLVDEPQQEPWPVVAEWVTSRREDAEHVARVLDGYDVAVVQHEYGIFGGADGEDVLEVVARLHVPVITVLHTVLTQPTPGQHRVVDWLVGYSVAVITMTETARDRLIAGWGVDPERVHVIPHGADDNRSPDVAPVARPLVAARRTPTVLTWGLLSEGKGIEWALLALAELRDRMPLPEYRVVGQTHPRVLEREGEAYRDRLLALTRDLGLTGSVHFDARYLAGPELRRVVREADVVLLPYDSLEQVTSGVLTEAVAAGKPVISTRFPHAVELLSGGAGELVPQRDASAIADALEHVLGGDGVAGRMAAVSNGLAGSLLWPAVAERYSALASSVRIAAAPVGL
ncbi:glycosyltransferase [Cellulomonas soli]|uniref:Glycosyl transferase family 1 n=1 Tax=Cellulomonas soli TaxID=931535 RepID=A0A512PGW5_9CELL|nr:glycosyltransferase [Cellulomonas soli]NYI59654.1 glycosyltransferase involved in cell wall biosynthesis [Cellulomonas soli]GEP70448.1 glycosyl transferase family 1 [Cellulomonas soli]